MDPNVKLLQSQREPLKDPKRYCRLVSKLNYLTITKPDITFAVSVVSQFLKEPCESLECSHTYPLISRECTRLRINI